MRFLNYFFLMVVMIAGFVSCQKANDSKIVFGVQPNEANKDFSKLRKEIKDRTGISLEFRNAKDYKDLVDQMTESKIDFGFFSPLNFVEIEKRGGVKVLLKKVYQNSEFYHSVILTTNESKVSDVASLKGKKIAFVDPNSASGFLYPKLMLHNHKLAPSDYEKVFAGTHDEALNLLINKSVDAAAVWADDAEAKTGAWTKVYPNYSPKVLSVSTPIPNDALVVREGLYNESAGLVLRFMDALISISEDTKILNELFGADRLVTATSRHYETVRELDALMSKEK